MVVTCCIGNCKSLWIRGDIITFHCFPKDESLRKQWISAIPSNILRTTDITQHSRLCSKHFTAECFTESTSFKSLRNMLNKNAVPTIFEEYQESQYQLVELEKETLPNILNIEVDPLDISNENCKMEKPNVSYILKREIGVQTLKRNFDESEKIIQSLTKRLKQRDKKIKDLEERLKKKETEEKNDSMKMIKDAVNKYICEERKELFLHEFANNETGSSKKTYSEYMRQFAAATYHHSPKVYKILKKLITLPTTYTAARWLIDFSQDPQFMEEIK
ncbi:PREDICTED: THAP domain-containing protein 1-like [Atta colombica]|uniref:THAP domain-containing protein 1-like n=1 Tax=Atta colombica TaxID=520822 RepID=UPI00084C9F47|nr:PREDICTED: THAP domain-containing protein 1-like [Atta colombica]